MNAQEIALKLIHPNPYQPRQAEDPAAIQELAQSILVNGLMQIPSARRVDDHFELAFGHSRKAAFELLASQGHAEFAHMPLIVCGLTDQQMFEMAVAENVKRRDLNPIELAQAMRRYLDVFKATSLQAAELFNVNDATVRGKVRLLELPEAAQNKLAAGEISEATARALLSMQKIAPEKTIAQTIERIGRNKDRELPEETIAGVVNDLQGAVRMWSESKGQGKPRSDWHKGWPLDMKNFPNDLLPALSAEEAAKALGMQARYLRKLEACLGIGATDRSAVVTAVAGADLEAAVKEKLQVLVDPPACTACPFYTRLHGDHFCGVKLCHERKTIAWRRNAIEAASRSLKIKIYEPPDGRYLVLDSYNGSHTRLFEKRDESLRLIPKEQVNGYHYQAEYAFKGVDDHIFYVVATGAALEKLPAKGRGADRYSAKARAEQARKRLFQGKRREITWEFTLAAKSMFDAMNLTVLKNLDDWKYLGVDQRPPKDAEPPHGAKQEIQAEYYRRLITWHLIYEDHNDLGWEFHESTLTQTARRLEKLAGLWGVKFPKRLAQMAAEGEAELRGIAAEAKKKAAKRSKPAAREEA